MRKVCFAIVDRANYGRLKPVMEAVREHSELEHMVVCGGSTPLARFKDPAQQIAEDGFRVVRRLFHEVEGSVSVSMARAGGLSQMDFAQAFEELDPDVIVVIGDRYQAVGVAMAAITLCKTLVHIQGGEVSGCLDERYRHMIAKAADYHVPATERAKENLLRMGEPSESILAVGCPSADLAARITPEDRDYILVAFHPDTNCPHESGKQVTELLEAVFRAKRQCKVLWPNIDSGANAVSKAIRQFRDSHRRALDTWAYLTNVEPEAYLQLIANAACLVGNSSSFVRDAGYFGSPVVLVGNRQDGRECGENVERVSCEFGAILTALNLQLIRGRFFPNDLYGKPGISKEIAERLATVELRREKRLTYELEAVA